MTKRWLGGFLVLSMGAVGCGNPVSSLLAEQQALADDVCGRCPEAVGADSEASCRTVLELDITDAEEACLRRVYADNSAELGPIFNCQVDAARDYRVCARNALATCPPTPADVDACEEALDAAGARCATPSSATQAELAACTSG